MPQIFVYFKYMSARSLKFYGDEVSEYHFQMKVQFLARNISNLGALHRGPEKGEEGTSRDHTLNSWAACETFPRPHQISSSTIVQNTTGAQTATQSALVRIQNATIVTMYFFASIDVCEEAM